MLLSSTNHCLRFFVVFSSEISVTDLLYSCQFPIEFDVYYFHSRIKSMFSNSVTVGLLSSLISGFAVIVNYCDAKAS